MAYRDGTESLEERQRVLRRALEQARARSRALSEEEAKLHRELADIHSQLADAEPQGRRRLPLAHVLLASPCDVPWDAMVGDDRVRHCASCKKDVHNLSAMTEAEVRGFLDQAQLAKATPGAPIPCVALYQRTDGTILTADCPVGVRRRRMRMLLGSTIGVGAATMIAFTGLALLGAPLSLGTTKPVDTPPVVRSPYVLQAPATEPGLLSLTVRGTASYRVYEGSTSHGANVTAIALSPGLHVLRIDSAAGESRTLSVWIYGSATTHMTASFEPPPRPMRAGGI